jgi:hypothetical protein
MVTRNKTPLFLAAFIAATFCTAGVSEAGKPTIARCMQEMPYYALLLRWCHNVVTP